MKMKCILPFSECVYLLDDGLCEDGGLDAPFNGDAKCFRIPYKKKMLKRAKIHCLASEIDDNPGD